MDEHKKIENNSKIESEQEKILEEQKDHKEKNAKKNIYKKKKPLIKKIIETKISKIKFVEGIYINAYKTTSNKFTTILDSAMSAGINTIVFDLKNMEGDVFFTPPNSAVLRDERQKMSLDIERIVSAANSRNMKVVSRLVMFHDQLLADSIHTYRPKLQDGTAWQESKRGNGSWLDSSNREVQKDLLSFIEQAAVSGVQEIQLDYVRFPTQGNVEDATFAFQREDNQLSKNDTTYIHRAKEDIIARFVEDAKMICDDYGVTLTADVFAVVAWQRAADIRSTGQNIERMTKYLDSIHPMIYSSHFSRDFGFREDTWNEPYFIIYKGTKLTKDSSNIDCKVIPYIQSNTWRVNYTYDYVVGQLQAVRDAGGDGYILWNSGSNYFQTLKWIKESKK